MIATSPAVVVSVLLTTTLVAAQASYWPGFRGGPAHNGVAVEAAPPLHWSAEDNVLWKVALPGPGSSSPIVIGDRIFVTSYSGYGTDLDEPGDPADLRHHLSCLDRATGELKWDREIEGKLPGEATTMQLREHGFASATPVSDGSQVFVYFDKVGLVAYDLDGELLWTRELGTIEREEGVDPLGDDRPKQPDGSPISLRWGAAASPLLHDGLVIVNASEESDSIRALKQSDGELVWSLLDPYLEGCSVSPLVVGKPGAQVLVMVRAGAVFGIDPATGIKLWTVETGTTTGMVPTPVADDEIVYTFGGEGDAFAIRFAADIGDEERVVWRGRNVGIPSPVLFDGKLFIADSMGMGLCLSATDGEVLFRGRLPGDTRGIYASPTVAGDRLYVVSRERGAFVYSTDGKFELLAHNSIEGDDTRFNASPVAVGGQLWLRSQTFLYCLADSE